MQAELFPGINVALAPPGYQAILKDDARQGGELNLNICTMCDWRASCQAWKPEYTAHDRYRCMPWARSDRASVVFKKTKGENHG
jgi:hypothetical protein